MSDDLQPQVHRAVKSADKPLSANAAANRVGCDPKTAKKYLEELVEAGRLYKLDWHPKATLYWEKPVIRLDNSEHQQQEGGYR